MSGDCKKALCVALYPLKDRWTERTRLNRSVLWWLMLDWQGPAASLCSSPLNELSVATPCVLKKDQKEQRNTFFFFFLVILVTVYSLSGVVEVYRVTRRVELGIKATAVCSEKLQHLLKDISRVWNNLMGFMSLAKLAVRCFSTSKLSRTQLTAPSIMLLVS